ncbi:MAG: hypothetical protein IAE78_20965 [Myxococcus sp.]|nr:hypothetical protein [Myxococcus sp.]
MRPAPSPSAEALEVGSALSAFVAAVERRDFERAYALLDGASRRRYSPGRLEADFALEPRGAALVGRLKAALGRPITVSGGRATLVVAEGRVAAAVHESDGWHVQSLDDALSVK